jgi:hypothetical protein
VGEDIGIQTCGKKVKMKYAAILTLMLGAFAFSGCSVDGGGNNVVGDSAITIAAIPGVVVPVRGATPVTTAIYTAQYTGTITWSPADNPFAATTVYTATIVLTAKSGYTLSGVAANFFTVAGATAANAANSGTVSAVFPATGAVPDINVVFQSAVQAGGISGIVNSSYLTLSFDVDPATLTVGDITVTGATKGALSGSGTTRSLAISNITVADGATVSVAITSPAGYSLTGSPQTAVVYRVPFAVTFQSAVQTGGTSGTVDSTGLTLSFNRDPDTLTAGDITVTGATKGALSGSGTTRSLAISNITVADGATVSVAIASPAGYSLTGSPQTAVVYRYNVPITFTYAVQTGGTSETADSTGLTLGFDVDPATLTAGNITVTGATKGALSGSGTTRSLAISNITVADWATVSVAITSPAGYSLTGSPQTAVVFRAPYIGMPYRGGVIAYIFQYGDPGYVSSETHGIIAATADQSTQIVWAVSAYESTSVPGGTGSALGTGSVNTDRIIAQNGAGTTYAAGLARAYTGGGYGDWYLPSLNELNKLYLNRVAVGGFADSLYWSSSQNSPNTAWIQNFGDGSQYNDYKSGVYGNERVRAVRSF